MDKLTLEEIEAMPKDHLTAAEASWTIVNKVDK